VRRFNLGMALGFGLPLAAAWHWSELAQWLDPFYLRLFLGGYLLVLMGLLFISRPAYCRFELTERKLVARSFYLIPLFFMREQRWRLEVLRADFRDFEFTAHNYGLTRELVVSVREQGRVVAYPPVSVVLLGASQRASLAQALAQWQVG
jgi:hypothetical protein